MKIIHKFRKKLLKSHLFLFKSNIFHKLEKSSDHRILADSVTFSLQNFSLQNYLLKKTATLPQSLTKLSPETQTQGFVY